MRVVRLFAAVLAIASCAISTSHATEAPRPFERVGFREPLLFERNLGQSPPDASYIARGQGYTLLVSPASARIVTRSPPADDATTPNNSRRWSCARRA